MAPAAPSPKDEAARLAKLRDYRILDTRPTEAFDRIARLASRLLQVPVATVAMVDSERIWFKAKIGTELSEVPRTNSFCTETICKKDAFIVGQAHLDPRFADYPFVAQEPFLRFYAGVPLTSPDGHNVGTLSVLDYAEREFDAEDRMLLKDLAKIVIDEMESHLLAERELQARSILYHALDAAPDGFVFYDSDDRMVLCNARYLECYPHSADLMVPGVTFEEVVHEGMKRGQFPAAKGQEEAWIAQRLEAHRNPGAPFEQQLPGGRWVRIQERRTRDGGTVGFRTDITELKEREFALQHLAAKEQEARDRLFDAIEALPDGFVFFDADDRLEMSNSRYREIYGASGELIEPGISFEEILRRGVATGQYPAAKGREEAYIAERLSAHRNPRAPIEQELPGGRWLRILERKTRDGGTVGFRTDITELKEREFALQRLATTDPLTGAMNRRRFMEAADRELRRARRYGAPLSVALIDIDWFKRINDNHGHAVGDKVLRRLVQEMNTTLREHDLVCRYGGEEFAILFPETDGAHAEVAIERLRAIIETIEICAETGSVRPTASIGCTEIDTHSDSMETALARADKALYEAKDGGRNCCRMWRAEPRLARAE